MLGQRPRQPRDPDQPCVRGDDQDRRRQHADVVAERVLKARPERQRGDDAEHGVGLVLRTEQGRVVVPHVVDRERHQRDDRDPGEDPEHRQQYIVDRPRDVLVRVARLLCHVRDRLDSRVGDHRDRQREDHLVPRRGRPQVHLVDEHRRVEYQRRAEDDQRDLRQQVGDREEDVQRRGLAQPADVQRGEHDDDDEAADDVARVVAERREERAHVVGHEEGADRDRDDVVERQRPAGEERHDLVERMARERRGAARFGEAHSSFRIRRGGRSEDQAADHEDEGRQSERDGRGDAERVVDRRADVPVRRREESRSSEDALETLLPTPPPPAQPSLSVMSSAAKKFQVSISRLLKTIRPCPS